MKSNAESSSRSNPGRTLRNFVAAALGACALAVSAGVSAAPAEFILPTPDNNTNATFGFALDAQGVLREAIIMNGIPIAFKYDNFWSYSGPLLDKIQTVSPSLIPEATFGAYDFSTGTGTIDVNITSVAGGATNVVGAIVMQDPADLASSTGVLGWTCNWGGETQTCTFNPEPNPNADYSEPAAAVGGTTTVGELLAYLQSIDPTFTVPVFYADYNQTGSVDSLWFSARVDIIDPDTDTIVDSWFLDAVNNTAQDPTNPTFNFGLISFLGDAAACAADPWDPASGEGCAGVTADGSDYTSLDHNKGSGHADFLVFAPDMDLSAYDGDFLFVVTGLLGCIPNTTSPFPGTETQGCNTDGGEEFGIAGGVGPTQVPEPGTLALLGLALGFIGWRVRRRLS